MPFVFLVVGIVMIVSAVRGTSDQLLTLWKGDFTGPNNYLYWMVSILIIGAIGYAPKLRGLSRAFLVLVIIVLFLSNKGFFQKFNLQVFGAPSKAGFISGWFGGPTTVPTTTSQVPNTIG